MHKLIQIASYRIVSISLLILFYYILSYSKATGASVFQDKNGNIEFEYLPLQEQGFPEKWPAPQEFQKYSLKDPTLNPGYYLIQTQLSNNTHEDTLLLDIGSHRLASAELQILYADGTSFERQIGVLTPLSYRAYSHYRFLIDVPLRQGETAQCRLKIYSTEYFNLPMQVGSRQSLLLSFHQEDIAFALFAGVFLSMILYNLFIFLTTRDKMYLLYVLYNFFMAYSQLSLFGFIQHHFLGDFPKVDYTMYMISGCMVGTFGCWFIAEYLDIKNSSKTIYRIIITISFVYPIYFILDLLKLYTSKELVYDLLGLSCFFLFYISVYISIRKGNLQTKFILAGWSLFMLGYVTFILKNSGFLPYNIFTHYGMITGAALEMLLLSFALADRINTLRKDNEKKQLEIIRQLETNELFLRKSKQLEIDKERLKKEILLSEYESLKKQINPHFLFNSLNVLSDLVNEEQKLAETFVSELAKVYRYILICEQESLVDLQTEIDFIKSFVFLLKIRFEEKMNVTIEIDNMQGKRIAPLTLQLLVENAVKHNVISSVHPLTIRIYQEGDYILVSNNFQARRDRQQSTGKGLKNIKSRYHFLSDLPVDIIRTEKEFIVKIPLILQKNSTTKAYYESTDYRG